MLLLLSDGIHYHHCPLFDKRATKEHLQSVRCVGPPCAEAEISGAQRFWGTSALPHLCEPCVSLGEYDEVLRGLEEGRYPAGEVAHL